MEQVRCIPGVPSHVAELVCRDVCKFCCSCTMTNSLSSECCNLKADIFFSSSSSLNFCILVSRGTTLRSWAANTSASMAACLPKEKEDGDPLKEVDYKYLFKRYTDIYHLKGKKNNNETLSIQQTLLNYNQLLLSFIDTVSK